MCTMVSVYISVELHWATKLIIERALVWWEPWPSQGTRGEKGLRLKNDSLRRRQGNLLPFFWRRRVMKWEPDGNTNLNDARHTLKRLESRRSLVKCLHTFVLCRPCQVRLFTILNFFSRVAVMNFSKLIKHYQQQYFISIISQQDVIFFSLLSLNH